MWSAQGHEQATSQHRDDDAVMRVEVDRASYDRLVRHGGWIR
jgi:hypothetical protein